MNAPGLLAERVAVPAPFAHPVPDSARAVDLACAEPYTVARTAVRRGGVTADDKTLVVGAGAQGLLLCQALLAIGVRPAVVEPHPPRLARAVELGARAAAEGEGGFGYVFESSGAEAALRAALERTAPGATFVLVGLGADPAAAHPQPARPRTAHPPRLAHLRPSRRLHRRTGRHRLGRGTARRLDRRPLPAGARAGGVRRGP